jgi:2-hydroxychromene-2-carboxylate isomerase
MRDYIQKVLMPRLLVAWFATRWPGRLWAWILRRLGGRAQVELYFAFDDPYSVVALPLLEVAARRRAEMLLYPIVERGVDGDPALEQRRRYAVSDSQRLLRRRGFTLHRTQPLQPRDTAFLAEWTESLRGHPRMQEFAAAALTRLWLSGSGPVRPIDFAALFREITGFAPPQHDVELMQRLADNHRRQRARGHWESPAARVQGEWFFAHERVAQIDERLAYLGW